MLSDVTSDFTGTAALASFRCSALREKAGLGHSICASVARTGTGTTADASSSRLSLLTTVL